MGIQQKNRNKGSLLFSLKQRYRRNRLGEVLVQTGIITPGQLKYALALQKQHNARLGHVLIHERLVTRRTLYLALWEQMMMRLMIGLLTIALSIYALGLQKAFAGPSNTDIPSLYAEANAAFQPISTHPALFGSVEKASENITPFTKWTGVLDRIDRALNNQDYAIISPWLDDLEAIRGQSLVDMAASVNDLVNDTRYIEDRHNWGKGDYWATPAEFIARGGDCEDFAIAKYVALRALGVPESRKRLAIVHDKVKDIPHAVLIVYSDTGPLVLDNQVKTVKSGLYEGRYRPIYSINSTAWWLHTAPESTKLASR